MNEMCSTQEVSRRWEIFLMLTAKTINLTQKEIEFNANHLVISLAFHSIPVQSCHGCSCVDECIPMLEEVRKVARVWGFPQWSSSEDSKLPIQGPGFHPWPGN